MVQASGIKANPPLQSSGYGTYTYPNKQGVVVEILNKGFRGLQIEKVYVNGGEIPEVAELGISESFALVQMLTPGENETRGISFHELNEYKVMPELPLEQRQQIPSDDREIIKYYGIWVQDFGKPIETVTIRYKYLDMPFTLQVEE